ncbi:9240_t:CDS:2, partial [Cetraspora pellucida]
MATNKTLVLKIRNEFSTFDEACVFIENYVAQTNIVIIMAKTTKNSNGSGYRQVLFAYKKQHTNKFAITRLHLKHNHKIYSDARKFSSNMHKFDQDELGTIEKLHDTGLQTKDIYVVLISISLKILQNDENIIASIATKHTYNNVHDQDGSLFKQSSGHIEISATKHQYGHFHSNKHIHSADEVQKAEVKKKKKDNNLLPHLANMNFDSHIPLNVILE